MTYPTTPRIEIEGLGKSWKRTPVLQSLDLSVGVAERVALVGANGAGKTTLIRCLLGEYRYQGRVRVGGLSPRRQRTDVLRSTGFVPQLPPPLRMPVGQLLEFSAHICRSDTKRMESVSARLGLDARTVRRQPFFKLSGGQKQKLLIAIALGRDCDLLLMDEPAANLDPDARRIFFELLAERADHVTMLISSHRLDEVAPLVHRVIELDCGRVVLDDRVATGDGSGSLANALSCLVVLSHAEEAAAAALRRWGLSESQDGCVWKGVVAGPDRLRFLGTISRYSGLVDELRIGGDIQ